MRARRRALLVVGSLARGGAERQTLLAAQALRSLGLDARVFVVSGPIPLLDDGLGGDVPLDLPAGGASAWRQIGRLRTACATLEPDVVLTFLASASIRFLLARASAVAARRPAWIVCERGNIKFDEALRGPTSFVLHRRCLAEADRVVVNSGSLAANVFAIAPSAGTRTSIVPNVLLPFRDDATLARQRVLSLLPAALRAEAAPVVGALGSFQIDRNYGLLAASLLHLVAVHPRLHLLVMGRTDSPECVEQHRAFLASIRASGLERHVTLAGEVPNGRGLLAGLDAVVLPSALEGSSNALAEAILCGAAIAATPAADAEQLLSGAGAVSVGWTGASLAQAILDVLAAPRSFRERAARRGAVLLAERSPSVVGERWSAVIEEAISDRRPRAGR